jgi:hypothetical protein
MLAYRFFIKFNAQSWFSWHLDISILYLLFRSFVYEVVPTLFVGEDLLDKEVSGAGNKL